MQHPDQKVIDEFVMASHGDLGKVKTLLERYPVLAQSRAQWGETPVEAAAHTGQREIAEFLLSKGAPLDICTASMLGRIERVREFLRADPALARAMGAHGIPVLFYPVITGRRDVAELLLANGADVNAVEGGTTPLHGAVLFGRAEMAAWLLDHGARVNATDVRGKTPLQHAVERGHAAVADLLRSRGGEEHA